MASAWTELWSMGKGKSRRYCGMEQTEDGFAVDVMRGDTCVASETFPSRDQAERAAAAYHRRYVRTRSEVSVGSEPQAMHA